MTFLLTQTTRSCRTTSSLLHLANRSFFTDFVDAARQIIRGDDHVNPKKKLERRYLYAALVATSLRQSRLESPESNPEDLFNKTFESLEARNLDREPNVDLRFELQVILNPQIQETFQAIHEVDVHLGVPFQSDHEQVMSDEALNICREVLLNEHETVLQKQDDDNMSDEDEQKFLATKLSAVETLLRFNDWSRASKHTNETNEIQRGLDPFGMVPTESTNANLNLIRSHQTLNICRSVLLREKLGFSVLCLRSNIAGRGLFIDGKAMAGTLVALQPGDVWPKEHLITTSPDVMEHFEGEDDCHISLRFDDYVLDSRTSPVTVLTQEGSLNPLALAHMVNHTAPGNLPNCQSTMFNYTAKTFKKTHLAKYIPNSYARTPTWQSRFFDREETIMHGLGLLSKRDLRNEELTYDYRLQSEETPEWYNVVKYDDGLEEDQVVFFRDDWRQKKQEEKER